MDFGNASFEVGPEGLHGATQSFFGALAGFVLLDVALLFWLLNPFSAMARPARAYPLMNQQAILSMPGDAHSAAVAKPSPLGRPLHSTEAEN